MRSAVEVLHIIKTLRLGGAEVNLLNLLKALDRARYRPHVAYSYGGELEPKFQQAGIRLFKYSHADHKVKSPATLGIVARLAGYILHNDIEIVHTHNFSAHIWGSLAAKLTGRKIVEHVHDFRYVPEPDFSRRRGFNRQYRYIDRFKRVSDRVIVLTRQNEEFLLSRDFYPPNRVRKCYNGVPAVDDNAGRHPLKLELLQELGLPCDSMLIVTPVRVAPEKNVDLILRIAPQVVAQACNAVFLIAGDGPLYEQTQAQIKSLGLSQNVKMLGYYADVTRLLAGADIFLLPSFLELHSIAVLEAMSMGVPVVISRDAGCHNEFIDGTNGLLLDPFSDEGWAAALVDLLRDPLQRQDMGQRGKQTCLKMFNINEVARKFEDLYDELALA